MDSHLILFEELLQNFKIYDTNISSTWFLRYFSSGRNSQSIMRSCRQFIGLYLIWEFIKAWLIYPIARLTYDVIYLLPCFCENRSSILDRAKSYQNRIKWCESPVILQPVNNTTFRYSNHAVCSHHNAPYPRGGGHGGVIREGSIVL